MAVQRLYKDAQVTIGPWIERGFYYDFDIKEPLQDKDLKKIRKEMQKIVRANLPFIREEVGARVAHADRSGHREGWRQQHCSSWVDSLMMPFCTCVQTTAMVCSQRQGGGCCQDA